jgi:prepilin-type N-terminal cleavage/methylation domain-containing protein
MRNSLIKFFRQKNHNQKGVTLFELLVAVLLLALVSTMIYSVLRSGINFNAKGEEKLQLMAQEQGLVSLLRRQVRGASYNMQKRQPWITANPEALQIITTQPFFARESGTVFVVYRYNEADSSLYYLEKKDFYNSDYNEDFLPDFDEMTRIMTTRLPLTLGYEQEAGQVTLQYNDREYLFSPRCRPAADNIILSRLEMR